jgi:acetyl esterase/lipase
MVRLGVLGLLFVLSLLVVVPAPTTLAWMLSILAAEWGYLIAIVVVILISLPWRRRMARWTGFALGTPTIVLSCLPLVQAYPIATALDANMQNAFGQTGAPAAAYTVRRAATTYIVDRTTGAALGIDLYQPVSHAPAPCVVVIHGGSWAHGERTELAPLNTYLAQRGYVVATIDYRLAPAHPFLAARNDVRAAIEYLQQHASQFGIDATRIILLGRSAGGQLALLTAYTAHDPAIRGVIGLYAPTDLRFGYAHPSNPHVLNSRSVLRTYLGGSPDQVGTQYDLASPINFVDSTTVPTLLIHGQHDALVSVRQAERLDSVLAVAKRPHLFLTLPWATHGCDFNFNGPCGRISREAILRFVTKVTE